MLEIRTIKDVEDEIKKVAETDKALPNGRPHGYVTCWRTILARKNADDDDYHLVSDNDIKYCDYIMNVWLKRLDLDTRNLIWWRCSKMPWKKIEHKLHSSNSTLRRRYKEGLETILKFIINSDESFEKSHNFNKF